MLVSGGTYATDPDATGTISSHRIDAASKMGRPLCRARRLADVSFHLRDPLGFYKVDLVFDNCAKFFSGFCYTVSMRSIWSAGVASLLAVAQMYLSEVVIGLGWVILIPDSPASHACSASPGFGMTPGPCRPALAPCRLA